jgi:16S rRNA (adenine1518-N6/adenine1519-N6)-dimethyltransferase
MTSINMIKANKSLGQNFLENENILKRIAGLLDPNLPVVEVGAGLGYLTRVLAAEHQVIAIEKDERFEQDLKAIKNVQVQIGDIMALDLDSILPAKYQAVGNLPYYLEKKIIHLFFKLNNPPTKAVFLIQKEVADELCQVKLSLFALSVKFYCHPRCEFVIKKGSFKPTPKVDGRVIVLEDMNYSLPFNLKREAIEKDFFRLLHFGFSSPRKKLLNNLAAGLNLEKSALQKVLIAAKIEEDIRAEDIDLDCWLKLLKILNERKSGR